jgi:hypothetical protein
MKRFLSSVLLGATSAVLLAQFSVRGPVILSQRGGEPDPPAGPDPSGFYQGSVTFTYGNDSFTQDWGIVVQSKPCPTCETGQYVLSGGDYDLLGYQNDGVDLGSVSGVVNRDGSGFLELHGTNCAFVTEGLGGSSYYVTGRLGPSPGSDLLLSGGNLTGRISGHDCWGVQVSAQLNLRKDSSFQPQTCTYRAGYYFGQYANSCGGSQAGDVVLTQAGCAITGFSAGAQTVIQGFITSPTTAAFDWISTNGCGGGSGTATIQNGIIRGTYTGTSPGGAGCCSPGPFTGSFTLTP